MRCGPCSESTVFAKRSIFHWFYKKFWEVRVQLQLDRPRTNMLFSLMEFHMFWRNISNYHGESDGYVALLSPWKSAMYWNNISNSLHESNVSDSADLSARRSINYLVNHRINRSVHLSVDFCVNHWISFLINTQTDLAYLHRCFPTLTIPICCWRRSQPFTQQLNQPLSWPLSQSRRHRKSSHGRRGTRCWPDKQILLVCTNDVQSWRLQFADDIKVNPKSSIWKKGWRRCHAKRPQ